MNNRIKIAGLFKDGWNLYVPVPLTPAFMEFLRRKICFSVDVAVISGGLEPDVDVFVLSDGADEKYVKGLIRDFKVK